MPVQPILPFHLLWSLIFLNYLFFLYPYLFLAFLRLFSPLFCVIYFLNISSHRRHKIVTQADFNAVRILYYFCDFSIISAYKYTLIQMNIQFRQDFATFGIPIRFF